MGDEKSICRDFERGVCNRGNKCKFYHTDGGKVQNQKLPICKDFQNKGCDRQKCKFLHITCDEETDYMMTGVLPVHGGHPAASPRSSGNAQPDVCKDFLNNICQRGSRCKFRHVTEEQHQLEQLGGGGGGAGAGAGMYGKRRRDEYGASESIAAELAEENEMLRRKITDLQRQVLDLRQMNDTLYDQNTRYRNQLRGQSAASAGVDPYAAKPVSYPSPLKPAPDLASRSMYDGYTQF